MNVPKLIETISTAVGSLPTEVKEEERLALMAAASALQEKLESPLDTYLRCMFGAHQGTAFRLGGDMKIFSTAVTANGPVTLKDLALEAGADPQLVHRIMRVLVAMKLFEEPEYQVYIAKPVLAAFMPPSPLAAAFKHIGTIMPTVASLPEYFAEKGYQNPNDAFDGPWQFTNQTKDHYFEWLAKRPEIQRAFNTVMSITRMQRGEDWFQFYPVEEKLKVSSSDDILLVDIGGGLGHDTLAFKKHLPNVPGKLVVQDLPNVVGDIKDLPAGIEVIGHNFFEPQPAAVKNARAYYLRTVLHDWPDKQVLQILGNIRSVMSEDSILLINENAMPDTNVPLYATQIDFIMMATFSSLDRTEKQFQAVLEEAGFMLLKVWRPTLELPGSAVLFEAMIKTGGSEGI